MKIMRNYRKSIIILLSVLTAGMIGCSNRTGSGEQTDAETAMNVDKVEDSTNNTGSTDTTDTESSDSDNATDQNEINTGSDETDAGAVIPYDFEITFETYENTVKSEDGSITLLHIKNVYPKVTSRNNPAAAEKISTYFKNLYSKEAIENKDVSDVVGTDTTNESDETYGESGAESEGENDTTDMSDIIEWAKEDYQMRLDDTSPDMPSVADSWTPYSDETTIEVSRADERILSFVGYSYMYTGGAHGNYVVYGDTFDSQTGDKLTFADLTEDEAAARAFVEEQITLQAEQIQKDYADGKSELALFDEYKDYIPDVLTDDSWYLTDKGFEVVANIYLLAPYAAGDIHFKIPYDQAEFIKEIYRK